MVVWPPFELSFKPISSPTDGKSAIFPLPLKNFTHHKPHKHAIFKRPHSYEVRFSLYLYIIHF